MISQITGKIRQKKDNSLLIDVNGICYEVFIPETIMRSINTGRNSNNDGHISLITYHYHACEPSRATPVLIGFLNEIEKEFFEKFITVSGIGPKAAVRALSMPISIIAKAIDSGNFALLKELPGIGQQRAREIIAKLQGKVGKFGLIQDDEFDGKAMKICDDIASEAMEILLKLQYSRQEATKMVHAAVTRNPDIKSSEEILNEVYKQRLVK